MTKEEKILQKQEQVYEILVDIFYLKDPLKSFEENNRQYIKTVNFGQTTDYQFYERVNHNVEPFMPLKWYLEYDNYYEAKYSHVEEYRNMVNEDDEFKRYYTNYQFDISQINQFVDNLYKELDQIINQQKIVQLEDPDKNYIKYTCDEQFINFQQRHQLEQQEPFIYGKYHLQKVSGCEHTKSGCQIYCDQCKNTFGVINVIIP